MIGILSAFSKRFNYNYLKISKIIINHFIGTGFGYAEEK